MASVYFHPDISNQDLKIIESKYNKKDTGYLINKASDFICEILSKKIKKKKKLSLFADLDLMVLTEYTALINLIP